MITAHLSKTPPIVSLFLLLRGRLLAEPDSGASAGERSGGWTRSDLAYAARHCSSLRVRAAWMSSAVMKRAPTPVEVEESEGTTASSAIGAVVAAADEKVLMARAWTGRLAIPAARDVSALFLLPSSSSSPTASAPRLRCEWRARRAHSILRRVSPRRLSSRPRL